MTKSGLGLKKGIVNILWSKFDCVLNN